MQEGELPIRRLFLGSMSASTVSPSTTAKISSATSSGSSPARPLSRASGTSARSSPAPPVALPQLPRQLGVHQGGAHQRQPDRRLSAPLLVQREELGQRLRRHPTFAAALATRVVERSTTSPKANAISSRLSRK